MKANGSQVNRHFIVVLKKVEVPNPFPGFHTTIIKMPHIYDNGMTDPTQRDQEKTKQSF